MRPHILIVDDLPANLGVLLGVLEGAGYEALVATSGERALPGWPTSSPT